MVLIGRLLQPLGGHGVILLGKLADPIEDCQAVLITWSGCGFEQSAGLQPRKHLVFAFFPIVCKTGDGGLHAKYYQDDGQEQDAHRILLPAQKLKEGAEFTVE